jgi:hypothetical protein
MVPKIRTSVSDQVNQLVHTNCRPGGIRLHISAGPLNIAKSSTVSSIKTRNQLHTWLDKTAF